MPRRVFGVTRNTAALGRDDSEKALPYQLTRITGSYSPSAFAPFLAEYSSLWVKISALRRAVLRLQKRLWDTVPIDEAIPEEVPVL